MFFIAGKKDGKKLTIELEDILNNQFRILKDNEAISQEFYNNAISSGS